MSISEIIKKLKEARNLETGEDETKRIRISLTNGKLDVTAEAIPDLDAYSLDQLYELQEQYVERLAALEDAEPDDDQSLSVYESWEREIDQLEQDLQEVEDKIEELQEENDGEDDAEEDEDEDDTLSLSLINVNFEIDTDL
jgi:hypothetical protein